MKVKQWYSSLKIVTTVWMLHSNVHVAPKFRYVYEHWAIMFEVTSITRIIGKSTCLQCKLALSTLPSFNEIWVRYLEMLKWPFLLSWSTKIYVEKRSEGLKMQYLVKAFKSIFFLSPQKMCEATSTLMQILLWS